MSRPTRAAGVRPNMYEFLRNPPGGSPTREPGPSISGRPGQWSGHATLIWQWAPNAWAMVSVRGYGSVAQDRAFATRLAENLRFDGDEPVRVPMAQQYLRENLAFRLTPAALEGLRTYYREAEALGVIARAPALHFYEGVRTGRAESEPIE